MSGQPGELWGRPRLCESARATCSSCLAQEKQSVLPSWCPLFVGSVIRGMFWPIEGAEIFGETFVLGCNVNVSALSFGQDPPHRAGRLWAQTATGPRLRSVLRPLSPAPGVAGAVMTSLYELYWSKPRSGTRKHPHDKLVSDLSVNFSQLEMGSERRSRFCESGLEPEMLPLS